jgi:hypothetical protein
MSNREKRYAEPNENLTGSLTVWNLADLAKSTPSKTVNSPAVELIVLLLRSFRLLLAGSRWSKLGPELLAESQLVILLLELRRLEQTADLGSPLVLGRLGVSFLLLLLDQVELGIVAGKLPEGDEEISQCEAELVVLRVEREEAFNKRRDLNPEVIMLVSVAAVSDRKTY